MESWKQAFWLAKLELKHSKKSILLLLSTIIVILLLVVPIIPDYFENSSLGLDFFFIVTFTFASQWARPKEFQSQKMSNGLWASHFLMKLNQLPIKSEIIVKYRLLTYLMISVPFQLLFLTCLYALTPILQNKMTIGTYLIFSIIWLCFSIYIGSSQLVSEAGFNILLNMIISFLLIILVLVFSFIIIFYKVYTGGFVHWTIFTATNHPIFTIAVSLLLAVIGMVFWMKLMQRKMETVDYL